MRFVKKTLFRTALLLIAAAVSAGCQQQPSARNVPPVQNASSASADAQSSFYNAPDLIGTLGGKHVRMSSYQIQDFAFAGAPGAFSRDWENYKWPEPSYNNLIKSFGFDMNYRKRILRDLRDDGNFYEELKQPTSPWVLVGVTSNNQYMSEPAHLNVFLEGDLEVKPRLPAYTYVKIPEIQYGLQRYIVPGNNPKTGQPWRQERSIAEDLFVAFDKNGNVRSYIKCSNQDVPTPPLPA